jgi:16S rRNA G966 N2-methylase RsmD
MDFDLEQQRQLLAQFEQAKALREQDPAWIQRQEELQQQELEQQRQLFAEFERMRAPLPQAPLPQPEDPFQQDLEEQCRQLEAFERAQALREQDPVYIQQQKDKEIEEQRRILEQINRENARRMPEELNQENGDDYDDIGDDE